MSQSEGQGIYGLDDEKYGDKCNFNPLENDNLYGTILCLFATFCT